MKSFTAATLLTLVALSAAAPTIEKRFAASITLYADAGNKGASYTHNFDTTNPGGCITLPASVDRKVSSFTLSPFPGSDGTHADFNCRLYSLDNCQTVVSTDSTWFLDQPISNFATDPNYGYFDNKAHTMACSSKSGTQ